MSFQLTRRRGITLTFPLHRSIKSTCIFLLLQTWVNHRVKHTHTLRCEPPRFCFFLFLKNHQSKDDCENHWRMSLGKRAFLYSRWCQRTGRRSNWGCRGPGRVGAAVRQWGCFAGMRGRPLHRAASPGWRPQSWRPRRTAKIRWRPWSWRSGGGRSPLRRSCYRCGRPWSVKFVKI